MKRYLILCAACLVLVLLPAGCGETGQHALNLMGSSADALRAAAQTEAPSSNASKQADSGAAEAAESAEVPAQKYLVQTETRVQYPTGDDPEPLVDTVTNTYDEVGNLLVSEFCSEWRGREHTTTYSYGENGLLLEECDSSGSSEAYTYDDSGNLTLRVETNQFGTYYYEYLSYDEAGRATVMVERYSEEGKLDNAVSGRDGTDVLTHKYSYDAAGQPLSETLIYSDAQGVLYTEATAYEYDPKSGLLLRKVFTYTGRSLYYEETTTYTCDSEGNVLREETSTQDGSTYSITHDYTYDRNGRVLTDVTEQTGGAMTSFSSNGEITNYQYFPDIHSTSTTSYTYDTSGNRTAVLTISSDRIYLHTYLYDENGNLLQEEVSYYAPDGSPVQGRDVTSFEYITLP